MGCLLSCAVYCITLLYIRVTCFTYHTLCSFAVGSRTDVASSSTTCLLCVLTAADGPPSRTHTCKLPHKQAWQRSFVLLVCWLRARFFAKVRPATPLVFYQFSQASKFSIDIPNYRYTCPLVSGYAWMPDRKGTVTGFVVAGFGAGAAVFDAVATAVVNPQNAPADAATGYYGEVSEETLHLTIDKTGSLVRKWAPPCDPLQECDVGGQHAANSNVQTILKNFRTPLTATDLWCCLGEISRD